MHRRRLALSIVLALITSIMTTTGDVTSTGVTSSSSTLDSAIIGCC